MVKVCHYFVTLRTNDQCEFEAWWRGDQEIRESGDLGEIFNSLKKLGIKILNITGGEPLMREDLPEILKQARESGLIIRLNTNGILYREREKELEGKIDELSFSLDYPLAEEHDRSRGVECFSEVIDALRSAKNSRIRFVMTRDSVQYLPEMVELAERLERPVELLPVGEYFGTQGFEPATVDHIKYYFKHRWVILNLALWEFVRSGGNRVILPRCKARETTVTLLPDGRRVRPCFYLQNGEEGRGDVCAGCLRFDYMLPSLATGFDKHVLLSRWSEIFNRRKL